MRDPLRLYLSARPSGGKWGTTERLLMDDTDSHYYRHGDRTVMVPTPVPLDEDIAALLAWMDTQAGMSDLNWSRSLVLSELGRRTVGGHAPARDEAGSEDSGLTGELSGLVGELTALTELRLDGNALTGRIPSKVAQLNRLTHVYLRGNALTGCMPPSLRAVTIRDLATLGLPDCGTPVILDPSYYKEPTLTVGTYQFIWPGRSREGDLPLIFDVPEGLEVRESLVMGDGGGRGLVLEDAATSRFWIGIDVRQG